MSSERDTLEETLDEYRDKIDFDSTAKISHTQDCWVGNCSLTGFMDEGTLKYQEQTGQYSVADPDTPDWNPRGCGRQQSYTEATYGEERIEQPMRQVGERGSGDWEEITWDEAFHEIAEAMVDAMEENPQKIINEVSPAEGGSTYGMTPFVRLVSQAGGINLDPESSVVQDFFMGYWQTFGKSQFISSQDEFFKADVNVIWHMNPAYTRQSGYHFLAEGRYHGGETVVIAPDVSPSTVHADKYIPVEPATDAAFALGMCRYIVEEGLVDREFVKEQSDLPLLVREDTDRYLREEDLEEDGRENWFYMWDADDGLVKAPRNTLELGDIDPVLEGTYEVEIDGETVEVRPVFEDLTDRLDEYDPETVQEISGVHPETVEDLATTFATKKTKIVSGMNSPKVFHGDLMERAMALLAALTGNYGREGTGIQGWNLIFEPSAAGEETATDPMLKRIAQLHADHDLTDEELDSTAQMLMFEMGTIVVPSAFFWYRHCGYDEVWDEAPMESAGIPRDIGDYLEEAVENGWWNGVDYPDEDVEPSVFLSVGTNSLRNKPGTTSTYLEELWPKLDLVVTADYRWSTTALHSDIVLPASFHHEKEQFHPLTSPAVRFWAYSDQAIDPVHNTLNEMEMMEGIADAVTDVAEERGLEEYEVPHGITLDDFNETLDMANTGFGEMEALPPDFVRTAGKTRQYDDVYDKAVGGLSLISEKDYHGDDVNPFSTDEIEKFMENTVDHCVDTGIFEEGTDLESVKEEGFAKMEGLGNTCYGLNNASEVEPDETITALDEHVQNKQVYPSLTGRAQFYLDHEWFFEADEHLPRHKSPPADHGGNKEEFPFFISSGHNRHSTHAITQTNDSKMNQHRGEPYVFINREAAERKGIEDGQYVRVENNYAEVYVQAKVSSLPAEDQIIFYHAWDPYLYPKGKGMKDLSPGLVKPLHFAGGYGHLKYRFIVYQQQQVYRHVTADVVPVEEDEL